MNYYIHKYNKITGYWVMQRKCNADTINKWLEVAEFFTKTEDFFA